MKSTNGCFVTAINGQHFIVMLNLLQNLGIYNSIHYPTQSNSIFFCPMRKNKGKIYCKTYLQFIKYPVKFSITPKAMNQFHILQWKVEEISVFIILANILALATLFCSSNSNISPLFTDYSYRYYTYWCQTPTPEVASITEAIIVTVWFFFFLLCCTLVYAFLCRSLWPSESLPKLNS